MPNQDPPIIYHYTCQAGLEGILKSKKIWATNIRYLNDVQEFYRFLDSTETQLVTLAKDLRDADLPFVEGVKRLLASLRGEHDIYTCSFTRERDSISQWKLYGSNYRGFSIGFDFSELRRLAEGESLFLQECSYDEKEQERQILGKLEAALWMFQQARQKADGTSEAIREMSSHSAKVYFGLSIQDVSRLKAPAFKAEQEWRLICHYDRSAPSNEVEFRYSGFSIIPYVKIDLPKNERGGVSISNIIIGPALNKELTRRSLNLLLPKYGIALNSCTIEYSDIKIRDSD